MTEIINNLRYANMLMFYLLVIHTKILTNEIVQCP